MNHSMTFKTILSKSIATGLLAAVTAGGVYGICITQRIASVDSGKIKRTQTITSEFQHSPTIREFANPRDHQSISDTRTYTLDIPPQHQHVSDRLLLARCMKAFYGGLVLGPERTLLRLARTRLTDFSRKQLPSNVYILSEATC